MNKLSDRESPLWDSGAPPVHLLCILVYTDSMRVTTTCVSLDSLVILRRDIDCSVNSRWCGNRQRPDGHEHHSFVLPLAHWYRRLRRLWRTSCNVYMWLGPYDHFIHCDLYIRWKNIVCTRLPPCNCLVPCLSPCCTSGTSSEIGGIPKIYALLQQAAVDTPVPGNQDGSYLTMKSNQGMVFGAATILSGFSGVFCDQGGNIYMLSLDRLIRRSRRLLAASKLILKLFHIRSLSIFL